jgi:hypothetical protein
VKEARENVMSVLTYIDSPFKLVVVVLLALMGFFGYFAYQNQGLFLSVYMKSQELPKINENQFDEAAVLLFKETRADFVVIFSVNPIVNKRVILRVYAKDGTREKRFEGVDVGLFTANQANNNDVVKLMSSEIPCGEYTRAQSEIGLWYLNQGVTYTCRISVPPEINQFIGQITVGWKDKPDTAHAHDMLLIAATKLVKDRR